MDACLPSELDQEVVLLLTDDHFHLHNHPITFFPPLTSEHKLYSPPYIIKFDRIYP